MSEKFYLTTTLPYVNADPHIGFALEIVQADALARHRRAKGDEVFFTTGTDEHGQKIAQKADESGTPRQEYVDHYAGEFQKLKDVLNLSYNQFIRTTDEGHKRAAQEIWRRCAKNCNENGEPDIYKKKFKGLYCVGDEMFLRESDLVDGRCPNHPNLNPVEIEEENYFFRLSRYQKYLEKYLSDPSVIVPEWQRQWALQFVTEGLEDFSVSREKARHDWGVPVPGDDNQVMYVWFDALTNYISTLGWPDDVDGNYRKFWEEGKTLQMAGKDQVRFQSIMWQAMLRSAELPATSRVLYHGFINSGGQKMSKSLGNVISPYELVEKYGTDATRYILLRHVHPFEDSDLTWDRMDEWYTANLVNGLGNLTSRIMQMASKYLDGPVDASEPKPMPEVATFVEEFEFNRAMNSVWSYITDLDQMIQEEQPFKVVKEDPERAKKLVQHLVRELLRISYGIESFMPETAAKIQAAVRENKKPETLFPRLVA